MSINEHDYSDKPISIKIYTVSELTTGIKQMLEVNFTAIWVEGEISNLRRPGSGHLYFTLKDEKAELKVVMFRHLNQHLNFKLEEGLQIIIYGGITVYERRGDYQISALQIEPKGLGALQLAFEQLKKRLKKEGLFDAVHKRSIPLLPRKIGVVTSSTGAAIRDIIHVISRRYCNIHIILNPVRVQGKGAAEEIAQAIEELNQLGDLDVLIIGRGGGSIEDLWAFNEEVVARSIYNSKTPVISAVGHEIDWTISDFTADLRAATPSLAAELVVAQFDSLRNRLETVQRTYAFRRPQELINQCGQRLDDLQEKIKRALPQKLRFWEEKVRFFSGRLQALSPLAVLSRGYALALKLPDKKAIRDVKDLKKDDSVKVVLQKGSFFSRVTEIQN